MLRLLFYTAVRVSEVASIRIEDIDLEGCKIFIDQGKGAKDRYILFPESFRLTLRTMRMRPNVPRVEPGEPLSVRVAATDEIFDPAN